MLFWFFCVFWLVCGLYKWDGLYYSVLLVVLGIWLGGKVIYKVWMWLVVLLNNLDGFDGFFYEVKSF